MKSQIKFNQDAIDKILKGVDVLTDAVSSTLSPMGRNVAIAKTNVKGEVFDRIILHDGVSVARSIDLLCEFENMGAQILRQAAQKQVDEVGDGTTLVIILAREILKSAQKLVASGVNPVSLRYSLEKAKDILIDEIYNRSKPITSLEDKIKVACISAENKELGKLIGNTIDKVGNEGVVSVEESKSADTRVEYQEGMQLASGYLSQYFATDPTTMEAVFENVPILITDYELNNFKELLPFFEKELLPKTNKIVVIAGNLSGDALISFVENRVKGTLMPLVIRAPYFGIHRANFLEDLALFTGATFISKEAGMDLSDIKFNDLGSAKYVKSDKRTTIISKGSGDKELIKNRIKLIKSQLSEETSDFNKEKLRERLGKLTDSIAVIHVGGETEVEMKERRERVLDAVYATKAAVTDGIVPGGEVIFLDIRKKLGNSLGEKIMFEALEKPFNKLMDNAGLNSGRMLAKLEHNNKENIGVDVLDGKIKNMIDVGIVDPTLVCANAIKNAVSVAISLLTTGTVIVPDEVSSVPKK